jgi:DNA-binding beta-propeller fold protein YncE
MKRLGFVTTIGLAASFVVIAVAQKDSLRGGIDVSGPYEIVKGWPQPIEQGWTLSRVSSVWAETPNRIWVTSAGDLPVLDKPLGNGSGNEYIPSRNSVGAKGLRGEHKINIFDGNGKLLESWTQWDKEFGYIHRLRTDPYDPGHPIWIVDNYGSRVFKFSHDGKKMLMVLGERMVERGDDTHFGGPNDIAFFPNGDFVVADGSRNRRVLKFNKDGKLLAKWGKSGTGPGEFGRLMSIETDAKGRVYVSDWGSWNMDPGPAPGSAEDESRRRASGQAAPSRGPSLPPGVDEGDGRIQVFDSNGKLLDTWPAIPNCHSISISTDQKYAWVTDDTSNKVVQYDIGGHLLGSWGTFGGTPGRFWGPHHLSVDSEGTLYVAEIYNGRAQKFRPKKGADPTKLVGFLFKERLK